jgi:hypothetical protein
MTEGDLTDYDSVLMELVMRLSEFVDKVNFLIHRDQIF